MYSLAHLIVSAPFLIAVLYFGIPWELRFAGFGGMRRTFETLLVLGGRGANQSFKLSMFAAFSVMFPDVDHVFAWNDVYWKRLVPLSLQEIFNMFHVSFRMPLFFGFGGQVLPFHYWIYPFILALILILVTQSHCKSMRLQILQPYLLVLMIGWSLHLIEDGCLFFT